jgi:hypothetical protein
LSIASLNRNRDNPVRSSDALSRMMAEGMKRKVEDEFFGLVKEIIQ